MQSQAILDNINVVLSRTSHPGNIGAAARAMKNMGLSKLGLINPKSFPDPKATERAVGADDLLEAATVSDSLEDSISDCHLVLGTSARMRSIPWPVLDPRQAAEEILKVAQTKPVAILFGNEKSGLTNSELQACHYHIHIPTNPDYSSLNLGAAVQVICYEIRMALQLAMPDVVEDELASHAELERFYEHLSTTLIENRFLHETHPKQIMTRLRRLFSRVRLEAMEVNLLRGVLTAFQRSARGDWPKDPDFKQGKVHEERDTSC